MLDTEASVLTRITETISRLFKKLLDSILYVICCVTGVLIAILFDALSGDLSGFTQINEVLKNFFSYESTQTEIEYFNLITFSVLCIITLVLCYIADANSKRNSFMLGAGIISLFFNNAPKPQISDVIISHNNNEIARVAQLSLPRLLIAQQSGITLRVNLTGKRTNEEAQIIIKSSNGAILNHFLTFENRFSVNVPRVEWYSIIVAAEGYRIEEKIVQASDVNSVSINLAGSTTPLNVQKIYRSILR